MMLLFTWVYITTDASEAIQFPSFLFLLMLLLLTLLQSPMLFLVFLQLLLLPEIFGQTRFG